MPIRILAKEKGPWYRGFRRTVLVECEADTLEGADLTAASLAGADLAQASLAKVRLARADLHGADLTGARLTSAVLDEATLDRAQLAGGVLVTASLRGASFVAANLWGANLTGARGSEACFDSANLMTARLAAGNFRRASFRSAELSQALARGAAFVGANFQGAVLKEIQLSSSQLGETDFTDAKLVGANLSQADAESANFTRAQLRGADLSEALLDQATLPHAGLSRANLRLCNLQQAVADEANFEDADLYGANLAGCSAREARFARAMLGRANLSGGNFASATFAGANLTECHAEGANLSAADLSRCHLNKANLRGASLVRANLWGAELAGCDFSGADLTGATLQAAQLADVVFDEATNWPDGVAPGGASAAAAPHAPHPDRQTLRGHHAPIEAVVVTPDGRLALSGDRSGELILWDLDSGVAVQQTVVGTAIRAIALRDGSQAVIAARHRPGDRGELRLFDILSWEESYRQTFSSELRTIAVVPGGDEILLGGEFGLSVWSPAGGEQPLRGDHLEFHAATVTTDGRFAAGLSGGSVCLFDIARRRQMEQLRELEATCLTAAAGGEILVGGGRKQLWRIDAEQGRIGQELPLASAPRRLAFDERSNQLLYAGADHRVRLVALGDGRQLAVDDHNSQPIYCVGFVPSAAKPATVYSAGYDHLLRLWTIHELVENCGQPE